MTPYEYAIVAAGSVIWAAPFPLFRSGPKRSIILNKRARWGVLLECLGYTLLWQGAFWTRSPEIWQVALSILFFAAGDLLSWTAARALGAHFRVDAALASGHELIASGPYGFVRHPIYTSMFCVVMGTGILVAPLYLFAPAVLLFLIGTEIRVRVEEQLLASQFGDEFKNYKRSVARFIPFPKVK